MRPPTKPAPWRPQATAPSWWRAASAKLRQAYPEDFALASAVLAYREGSSTTARFGEVAPAKPERGNRFFDICY